MLPRLMVGEPYADAEEHLAHLFSRLEILLERLEARRQGDEAAVAAAEAKLAAIDEDLASRERVTDAASSPFLRLRESLRLGREAETVLVALAASELDPRLLARLSRLWQDERRGDVAFYRELLGSEVGGRAVAAQLTPDGALARHGLIQLTSDRTWGAATPRLFSRVRMGNRVANYLAGELLPGARALPAAVSVRKSGRPLERMIVAADVVERLRAAIQGAADPRGQRLVCLIGPSHLGRKSLVQAVIKRPLVRLDCARLPNDLAELASVVREALCETALQNGALYLDRTDALIGEQRLPVRQALSDHLGGLGVPLFAGLDGVRDALSEAFPDMVLLGIPMPDSFQQSTIWSLLLPESVQLSPGYGVDWVAQHYSLPAGAIQRSVDDLVRSARLRGESVISHDVLVAAVRRQLGSRFGDLAELVVNTLSWDDLVLPTETMQRVLEVVMYFRHRETLLRDWGFEAKLPYGKSLSVLLSGEPGTGKTMVAGLLAKEMGLELFRVNTSKVVDKYIGETEKNLARVFEEARRGQVALLFDEADSLFSKRTEVRNSTDRYSNLAINYLLQSVESHDGVIILTTNHEKAMDQAFKRRLRFRVNFPFPELAERTALWKSMLPRQARVQPNIRWEQLAKEFNLAGGSIKNAVVRAALHAVEKQEPLSDELLRHAGRLESEEMGQLVKAAGAATSEPKEEDPE